MAAPVVMTVPVLWVTAATPSPVATAPATVWVPVRAVLTLLAPLLPALLELRLEGADDAAEVIGKARHFVVGDRGVSEWTFTGTRADGSHVEVHGCDIFTFRDGRIALKNSYRKNRPPTSSANRGP